jgi:very-short-patch-repair endonuclease
MRPSKPARTLERARRLRRTMSLPEVLLWRELKANGLHFRKQHRAGAFVLDFFCARANLAVEVDGISHDMGNQPERDIQRDAWLRAHRIDVVRIAASEVLRDPYAVAQSVTELALERLAKFGKAPPSSLRDATSPSQVDGEDRLDGGASH